jgi:hypothetical protein
MRSNKQAKSDSLPQEWVGEIVTRPSHLKALVVSFASIMLLGLAWAFWSIGPAAFKAFLEQNVAIAVYFEAKWHIRILDACFKAFLISGLLCASAGLVSLLKCRLTYHALNFSLLSVYIAVPVYVTVVWLGLFEIHDAGLEINGEAQDRATIILLWWSLVWPALAVLLYAIWLRLMLRSRAVYASFTKLTGAAMWGDKVLEDIRTHGRDRQHRLSLYASIATHILVLIIIPWLMGLFTGSVEAYKVPKGSGNPVVAMVKMVKPKKEKKKTLTLRPNSTIITAIPDLDETEVDKQMEEKTQATYESGAVAKVGKIGKGGGTDGGWPAGMDDYKVRFIRLEHSGDGWDDGMDESGADLNFLRAFSKITGLKKIATSGESHPIALLKKYPSDAFPPFVYLTGNDRMGNVSNPDVKILRDYCMGGGMLIADAGSAKFHESFLQFIKRVFPDKPLIDIADDDMIFQSPHSFPNGAPAFWGHGGRRALGVKHDGRWVVFYHPGDINDAWKSPSYTDVEPELREAAMNLGVNLVNYAFNSWDDAVTKIKK